MTTEKARAEDTNRAHWDEVAPIHLKSYGIEGLMAGISRIDAIQRKEFYPVKGKDLIHLQCHIGTDTLLPCDRRREGDRSGLRLSRSPSQEILPPR